jgi:hypothetical protein
MVGHLAKGSVNKPHASNKAIERLNCTLRERVKGAKRMKPELTPFLSRRHHQNLSGK